MKPPRAVDTMKSLSAKARNESFGRESESLGSQIQEQPNPETSYRGSGAGAIELPVEEVDIFDATGGLENPRSNQTAAEVQSISIWGQIGKNLVILAALFSLGYVVNNLCHVWAPKVPLFASGQGYYTLFILVLLLMTAVALGIFILRWLLQWRASLETSSQRLTDIASFAACGIFWALVFIGIADFLITFLRLVDLSETLFGEELSKNLFKKEFRFPFVHFPLFLCGFIFGFFFRHVSFIWLALMIVIMELVSAISANVFFFTNVFIDDLVRLWYAGLFLMSAAYTLVEGGHVRVDVVFAGLNERAKNWINLFGSILLGLPFAWVILIVGTIKARAGVINGPLSSIDIGQNAGAGLFLQYLMPLLLFFLGLILALQFCSLILSSLGKIEAKQSPVSGGAS